MPKTRIDKGLPKKLEAYLAKKEAGFNSIFHRTVFTALDLGATLRKKMGEIAKCLLVKADHEFYVVLLAADRNLDVKKLAAAIAKARKAAVRSVRIQSEAEMMERLGLKSSGLLPFAGIYQLPVCLDRSLLKAKKAIFPAGDFVHSLEMALKEFVRIETPLVADFGVAKKYVPPEAPAKRGRRKTGRKSGRAVKKAVKRTAKPVAAKKRAAIAKKAASAPAKRKK